MTELIVGAQFHPAVLCEEQGDARAVFPANPELSRYETVVAVRRGIQARISRGRFFNSRLFSDPAWDILLELYAASLAQRRLTVSRLSERSHTPLSTALRWIAALESEGLVRRQPNPLDGRQIFIALSDEGTRAMDAFFDDLQAETELL